MNDRDSADEACRRQIDLATARFREAVHADQCPHIEEYLADVEADCRDLLLFELVQIELSFAPDRQNNIDEYLERFPEAGQVVRRAIAFLGRRDDSTSQPAWFSTDIPATLPSVGLKVRCPHCQSPIEVIENTSLVDITCDSCGSRFSLVGNADTSEAPQLLTVGHFELFERLGQGGFGTVWKARDKHLDRTVAVKIPRRGQLDGGEFEQFFREARSAAQLRHPNIVSVHEVGRDGDTVYIVSDMVRGMSLAEMISTQRLSLRESASLCVQIALALDHAHQNGIVHRDLKPQNILVDHAGTPHLTDFGLAKRETGEITMTIDGQLLGTPAYMSPEQASGHGHTADGRADIYSLGVVLFQLLTGELPFRGSRDMLIHQVLHVEPPSPRTLDQSIPRDMETICLKCLAKDLSERYPTASSLENDLSAFLEGRPIQARPVGAMARAWRWCTRNRAIALLVTTVALLLVAGAVVASIAAFGFNQIAQEQRITLADMHMSSGLFAHDKGDTAQASLWFANAAALANDDERRSHYNRLRFWNWVRSLPHLQSAWFLKEPSPASMQLHPRGRYLSTVSNNGQCRIWNVEGKEVCPLPNGAEAVAADWSADGNWLAVASEEEVYVFSLTSEQIERSAAINSVNVVRFSHDSATVALGGSDIRLWRWREAYNAPPWASCPATVAAMAFAPDDTSIAVSFKNGTATTFSVSGEKGTPDFEPVVSLGMFARAKEPRPPRHINNARHLITQTGTHQATVWNAETGQQHRTINAPKGEQLLKVVGSPDGNHFVVCNQRSAQLWDAHTMTRIGEPLPHSNFIYDAAFSMDGQRMISVSADRRARIWSIPSGKLLSSLPHQDEVWYTGFAAGTLVTVQADGLVRVWSDSNLSPVSHTVPLGESDHFMKLSTDGKHVLPIGWNYTRKQSVVQVFNIQSGALGGPRFKVRGWLNGGAFAPDGRHLIALSSQTTDAEATDRSAMQLDRHPGVVHFIDWLEGQEAHEPVMTPSEPIGAAYNPKGNLVVVLCAGGEIDTFDANQGRRLHRADHGDIFYPGFMIRDWVRFFPDGSHYLTWGLGSLAHVWDATTGTKQYSVEHAPGRLCHDVSFSADGNLFATASSDTLVRVIRATDGKEVMAPLKHPDWVLTVRFSPSENQILTGCRDGMARLWSLENGQLVCPPFKHDGEVMGVNFSIDGQYICTCSRDGSIQLWEWETGHPITPGIQTNDIAYQFSVTPEGAFGLISGTMPSFVVLDLAQLTEPAAKGWNAEKLRVWGELLSGQDVYLNGGVDNLTSKEWFARWKNFHR